MKKNHHYRLYDKDNVYLRECHATNYDNARKKLKPSGTDRIFCVEEDNHEVECGMAWINDMLDNG